MSNILYLAGVVVAVHLAWRYAPSVTGLQFAVLAGLLLAQVD
jgi:hypothetical protein